MYSTWQLREMTFYEPSLFSANSLTRLLFPLPTFCFDFIVPCIHCPQPDYCIFIRFANRPSPWLLLQYVDNSFEFAACRRRGPEARLLRHAIEKKKEIDSSVLLLLYSQSTFLVLLYYKSTYFCFYRSLLYSTTFTIFLYPTCHKRRIMITQKQIA